MEAMPMFIESAGTSLRAIPGSVAVQPTSLQALFSKLPAESLSAGQTLILEGDVATSVFHVVTGSLRIFRILGDGRRVITGFLHAGDILGMSFRSHYIYTAEAITPVTIRRLSRKSFEHEIAVSPDLGPAVFHQMSDEMAAAQDQMVLAFHQECRRAALQLPAEGVAAHPERRCSSDDSPAADDPSRHCRLPWANYRNRLPDIDQAEQQGRD
jgi:CRP-like cAMP-binding protein